MQAAAADAKAKAETAAKLGLAAGQLKTEVDTLAKLLMPAGDSGLPPMLDQIKVAAGYEMALAAALGEDLDVPAAEEAPVHWRINAASGSDPALPKGVQPLIDHVAGPAELTRRLRQIGIVARADGPRLQKQLAARPASRLPRGRPVALGRIRRRRAGRHGGRQPAWPSAAASARWPPRRRSRARPRTRRATPRRPLRERHRRGAGRGAQPAPALARDPGQAGADPRRADRHGAAGARDRGPHRRRSRRQIAHRRGPGRGA